MKPTTMGLRLSLIACISFFIGHFSLVIVLAQPPVPHNEEQNGVSYEDCMSCHHAGKDDAPLLAVDHVRHKNEDCRVCHSTTGMLAAPAISHPLAGWEDCRGCHDRWDGEGIEIPNLADSEYDHALYGNDTCASCHALALSYYAGVPPAPCGVCHPQSATAETVHNGRENWVDCVDCHQAANQYPHDLAQMRALDEDCTSCHYQKEAHWTSDLPLERYSLSAHIGRDDPHARVDCAACHVRDALIERDPETNHIFVLVPETEEGVPPDRPGGTDIVTDVNCYQRCHFSGNAATAPAAELPPRSVLCLTCHSGSPVVKDYLSRASIGTFGVGMLLVTSMWVQGLAGKRRERSHSMPMWRLGGALLNLLTGGCVSTLKRAFTVDRVARGGSTGVSRCRWFTCACMLVGVVGRMALGVLTWLITVLAPVTSLTQTLVDKNAPGVALVNDGLGLLVVLGVMLSILRRIVAPDRQAIAREQDTFGAVLVGLIFLMGFAVEGTRILVTDLQPSVAVFSFVGYPISLALRRIAANWGVIYGSLWYVHAGLVAALIAYAPFSKFMRVLVRPVVATFGSALEV